MLTLIIIVTLAVIVSGPFLYWKSNSQVVRGSISVVFFIVGYGTFALYAAGSHGHFTFRPDMHEDWLLWGVMTAGFGLPLLFILQRGLKGKPVAEVVNIKRVFGKIISWYVTNFGA